MARDIDIPEAKPAFELIDGRPALLALKVGAYVRNGSQAVIVVDPRARTAVLHDAAGTRDFGTAETITHPAFPGLRIDMADLFTPIDDLEHR